MTYYRAGFLAARLGHLPPCAPSLDAFGGDFTKCLIAGRPRDRSVVLVLLLLDSFLVLVSTSADARGLSSTPDQFGLAVRASPTVSLAVRGRASFAA